MNVPYQTNFTIPLGAGHPASFTYCRPHIPFPVAFVGRCPEDRAFLPEKSDLGQVFYLPRHFFAKTLAAGEFALWNPHVYAGYPQFADPQAATFYPIALLIAWIVKTNYTMATVTLDIGLHFFLVGAFSFLFFRHLFKANLPALLSALLFEFGGYLTLLETEIEKRIH